MSLSTSRAKTFALTAWARGIGLAAASGALALGAGEVLIRAAGVGPSYGPFTVTSSEFNAIPGIYGPNQRLTSLAKPKLPHDITINRFGVRGADFELEKRPGEFRILMLGDSQTLGDYVDDDETLPAQLQLRLQGACADVTVINGGLSGATIVDARLMFERLRVLGPDLVVLSFTENDIGDMTRPVWYELASNRERKSRFPMSVAYPLLRETAFWNLLLQVNARRTWPVLPPPTPGAEDSTEQRLRRGYASGLGSFQSRLESLGLPFVTTAIGGHDVVLSGGSDERLRWFATLSDSLGIDYIETLPALRALVASGASPYLLPHDGHPSPPTYETVASLLSERIAARCRRGPSL